jgi:hypothetical protein
MINIIPIPKAVELARATERPRAYVSDGSFTTDAFSTRADQRPLFLQERHYCSAQRTDAKGHEETFTPLPRRR